MPQIDNNLEKWICITNLIDKSNNIYFDKKSLIYPQDWFRITDDIVDLIYYYVNIEKDNTSRIEFSLDDNLIRKYSLPFDQISIYVYRDGEDRNFLSNYMYTDRKFLSNYMYTDIDGYRTFMVDLYFTNNQLLTGYFIKYMIKHCILMEMNNCFNRDIYKNYD